MLIFWRVWYEETKELIKFCKDKAYLIDDGYKVVTETRNKDLLKISLYKPIDIWSWLDSTN
jgi:hypothetical protein